MSSRRIVLLIAGLALVLIAAVTLVGLTRGAGEEGSIGRQDTERSPASAAVDPEDPALDAPLDAALDAALSEPRVDDFYPDRGGVVVDALHYDLDLAWDPDSGLLSGDAEITFRAAKDAETFTLDLADPMLVTSVALDGDEVEAEQGEDTLTVMAPVESEGRYLLAVEYAGPPTSVAAPTTRSDLEDLGLTVTPEGRLWTMQEPYGAFTWYPVDDQPADKALYDFTVTAPGDWVGIANGELTSRESDGDTTVTTWHLGAPTAAYLTTLAVGPYVESTYTSDSGVPVASWTIEGEDAQVQALARLPQALAYNEDLLGDYPYDSLGAVVVDSLSGMETATMLTLGDGEYPLSEEVLVHEIAHQWYGDLVTPTDWRDLWMNEGMATIIQKRFEAERSGRTLDAVMGEYVAFEGDMRRQTGPPGDPDPQQFGEGVVYYGPALMWNDLRRQIGDAEFWRLVRAWPTVSTSGSADREQYLTWWSEQTGRDLGAFFDAWLMGARAPAGGSYQVPPVA